MNNKKKIVFWLCIFFLAGFACGLIVENINLNKKIQTNLINIAADESGIYPHIFSISGEYYRIEKINISGGLNNDSIIKSP